MASVEDQRAAFVLAVSDARDRLARALECIEFAQRFDPLGSKNADRLESAHASVIDADDWLDEVTP